MLQRVPEQGATSESCSIFRRDFIVAALCRAKCPRALPRRQPLGASTSGEIGLDSPQFTGSTFFPPPSALLHFSLVGALVHIAMQSIILSDMPPPAIRITPIPTSPLLTSRSNVFSAQPTPEHDKDETEHSLHRGCSRCLGKHRPGCRCRLLLEHHICHRQPGQALRTSSHRCQWNMAVSCHRVTLSCIPLKHTRSQSPHDSGQSE